MARLITSMAGTTEELQEVAHSGGKLEFLHEPGHGTSVKFSQASPWALSLYQVCVSYDGDLLGYVWPGFNGPIPQPSIQAFLVSDREGMFGQRCPSCKTYFRATCLSERLHCPYCGHSANGMTFLTNNQKQFIHLFCVAFSDAHNKQESATVDLDQLADQLSENRPGWVYSEERQQSMFTCTRCRCRYDILGDYGICPNCETPNFMDVITKKLDHLEEQFRLADEQVTDRHEREIEWEKLTRCVSEFEALAKAVRTRLQRMPLSSRRRTELASLSFQVLPLAAEKLLLWFDIDVLANIGPDDKKFLHVMFNRRHVFTHNAGRVDQEYLDRTGDSTVRLNEVLRVRSKDIRRLLGLTRQCSANLIEGYASIGSEQT